MAAGAGARMLSGIIIYLLLFHLLLGEAEEARPERWAEKCGNIWLMFRLCNNEEFLLKGDERRGEAGCSLMINS